MDANVSRIERELHEIIVELLKTLSEVATVEYEKTHATMLKCLGRLGDLIILNHQWVTGEPHPLKELELQNIKRVRPDKQGEN